MSSILQILFKTKKEGNAAEDVQKQIATIKDSANKATDALDKQAQAQKRSTEEVRKSVDASRDAADGAENLATGLGMLGSGRIVGGIRFLTTGIKALWTSIIANPIGLLVTAISAAIAAFIKWRQHTDAQRIAQEQADAANAEYARNIATQSAALQKEYDAVAEATRRALTAASDFATSPGFDAITRKLAQAADDASRMRQQMEAAADLDLAAALADIDLRQARGELTAPDAELARQDARVQAADARAAAQRREIEERMRIADEKVQAAQAALGKALSDRQSAEEKNNRVQNALNKVGANQKTPDALQAELDAANQRMGKLQNADPRYAAPLIAELDKTIRDLTLALGLINRGTVASSQADLTRTTAAQGEAAQNLIAARQAREQELKSASFGLSTLDRRAGISKVEDQARRQQIENQRQEQARAEEAKRLKEERDAAAEAARKAKEDAENQIQAAAEAAARALAQKETTDAATANAEAASYQPTGTLASRRRAADLRAAAAQEQNEADQAASLQTAAAKGDDNAIQTALGRARTLVTRGPANGYTSEILDFLSQVISQAESAAENERATRSRLEDLERRLGELRNY